MVTDHPCSSRYHFSANIRIENIALGPVGANLSILTGSILTHPLNGTQDWQEVGFYLKVESPADVVLTCRLGGFFQPEYEDSIFPRHTSVEDTGATPGAERTVIWIWKGASKFQTRPVLSLFILSSCRP